jgi:Bacterial Ig domain
MAGDASTCTERYKPCRQHHLLLLPSQSRPHPTVRCVRNGQRRCCRKLNCGITKVEFYIDGVLNGSLLSGPFPFPGIPLDFLAPTRLVSKAYDAAGGRATSAPDIVTVASTDTTPPSVQITSIGYDGKFLTVTVSATDAGRVSRVELYIDGTLKATDSSAPYASRLNARPLSWGSTLLRQRLTTTQAIALSLLQQRSRSKSQTRPVSIGRFFLAFIVLFLSPWSPCNCNLVTTPFRAWSTHSCAVLFPIGNRSAVLPVAVPTDVVSSNPSIGTGRSMDDTVRSHFSKGSSYTFAIGSFCRSRKPIEVLPN